MEELKGSATFRIFSYGAFLFFLAHVGIQWLLTKLIGPYGKRSTVHNTDGQDEKSKEALDIDANGGRKEKLEDGFKDIDLTR